MPVAFNPYSISSVAGFVQQMTPEQKQAPETHLRENAVRSAPNAEALSALLTTHYTGSELMNLGLCVRLPWGDAASVSLTLEAN